MTYLKATNLGRNYGSTVNNTATSWVMYRQDPPASQTVYAQSNTNLSAIDETYWQGYKIRGFHERLRKGELLPHTPWKRFHRSGSANGWLDTWVNPSNPLHFWTSGNYVPGTHDVWCITEDEVMALVPPLTDRYVGEAAAKIYENGWDALTFLAELTSVRGMFSNAVKKLAKLKIPRNWKQLSDDWLESRYGWRTLLYDIDEISQLIATFNERRSRYSERAGDTVTTYMKDVETKDLGNYYVDDTRSTKVEVSYRGSVTADIEVPRIQFNLIQTAWELVPLSFVVDWFYTVGKSLSAASFLAHESKYAASKGLQVELTRTYTRNISGGKASFVSGNSSWSASAHAKLVLRQPCRVPLVPHTTLRLNNFKIIDLLSIGSQRIPRR